MSDTSSIEVIRDRLDAAFALMVPETWSAAAIADDSAHGIAMHVWFALRDCHVLLGDSDWPATSRPWSEAEPTPR